MYTTYAIEERQRERKKERVKKLSGPVFFSLSLYRSVARYNNAEVQ